MPTYLTAVPGAGVVAGVAVAAGVVIGSVVSVGFAAHEWIAQDSSRTNIKQAINSIALRRRQNPTGCARSPDGTDAGVNASHERVSVLTCIPYLTPACLALVQL